MRLERDKSHFSFSSLLNQSCECVVVMSTAPQRADHEALHVPSVPGSFGVTDLGPVKKKQSPAAATSTVRRLNTHELLKIRRKKSWSAHRAQFVGTCIGSDCRFNRVTCFTARRMFGWDKCLKCIILVYFRSPEICPNFLSDWSMLWAPLSSTLCSAEWGRNVGYTLEWDWEALLWH